MAETEKLKPVEKIERAARGLVYISETDSEVEMFKGGRTDTTDISDFRREIGSSAGEMIEESDAAEFFARLSARRDWHSERDRKNADGFAELYRVLSQELSELKVYRVGLIQLRIYVVGIDRKGRMRGVLMRAVET